MSRSVHRDREDLWVLDGRGGSKAGLAGVEGAGESIGDALALLAGEPTGKSLAAVVILRCLAVPELVPEPNAANQIVRATVELCEGAVPEIVSFLKIDKRSQNFEKFAILKGLHSRIKELLDPLRLPYGDLSALLHRSHDILGSLNHVIVRRYGEPYNLKEVRAAIELVLSKLKRVSALDASLLVDVEECQRVITSIRANMPAEDSFLNKEFLGPFLNTCEAVLIAVPRLAAGSVQHKYNAWKRK
jgi:hypothetical protein